MILWIWKCSTGCKGLQRGYDHLTEYTLDGLESVQWKLSGKDLEGAAAVTADGKSDTKKASARIDVDAVDQVIAVAETDTEAEQVMTIGTDEVDRGCRHGAHCTKDSVNYEVFRCSHCFVVFVWPCTATLIILLSAEIGRFYFAFQNSLCFAAHSEVMSTEK